MKSIIIMEGQQKMIATDKTSGPVTPLTDSTRFLSINYEKIIGEHFRIDYTRKTKLKNVSLISSTMSDTGVAELPEEIMIVGYNDDKKTWENKHNDKIKLNQLNYKIVRHNNGNPLQYYRDHINNNSNINIWNQKHTMIKQPNDLSGNIIENSYYLQETNLYKRFHFPRNKVTSNNDSEIESIEVSSGENKYSIFDKNPDTFFKTSRYTPSGGYPGDGITPNYIRATNGTTYNGEWIKNKNKSKHQLYDTWI